MRDLDTWDENRTVVPVAVGFTGSAVIGDMEPLELFYGINFMGYYYLTTIGVKVPLKDDMKTLKEQLPVKLKDLKVFCREAPTTNQIYWRIDTK